ncbi:MULTISPECIES: hypothetical protein [Burkholderia]|uniref:hypothetical protein n=1 Tax=Burkholderia TaxID=32008 RepID=UPI000AB55EFC|nr:MULTISPECIES: hypothetical protein [Burkholderia]
MVFHAAPPARYGRFIFAARRAVALDMRQAGCHGIDFIAGAPHPREFDVRQRTVAASFVDSR